MVVIEIAFKELKFSVPILRFSKMFKLGEVQSTDAWGPGDEWQLEGALKDVPFAPFSKGDKLGRAADWTAENKDGRDPRSRQGYNRNYRGPLILSWPTLTSRSISSLWSGCSIILCISAWRR